MKRNGLLLGFLLLFLLTMGFFGGLVVSNRIFATTPDETAALTAAPEQAASPVVRPAVALQAAGTLPDLSPVAEAALKVAANISSTTVVQRRTPWPFWFDDEPQFQQSQSLGSGVIVSADGLILTNTHVIGDARAKVRVTLFDGRERDGNIIGIDDLSDLAVVKVQAQGLPTLPWGDSSKLRVAEWVLAIGNPFQLSGTVTLGIVSTVSRSQSGAFTDFIQTDAAINPGNSGGALVNARGELVGINSMIYSETGGYQGIGFAIPANLARRIMQELVTNGSVSWGSLGYLQVIDSSTAARYGARPFEGLMVVRMTAASAAYKGGIRPEDIILTFNGQKATDVDALDRLVAQSHVGDRAKVEVDRNGKRLTLDVTIESRQQQQPMRRR